MQKFPLRVLILWPWSHHRRQRRLAGAVRGGRRMGDVLLLIQYSSMPQWPAGTTSYFQNAVCEKAAYQSNSLCIIITLIIVIGVRTIMTAGRVVSLEGPSAQSSQPATSLTDNNGSRLQKRTIPQTTVDRCFTSKRKITKMGLQHTVVPLAVPGIHPLGFSIVFPQHAHTMQWLVYTCQSYLLGIFTQCCKTTAMSSI